jgi:pimeloyl-ACP methyl ester carboxylesterase
VNSASRAAILRWWPVLATALLCGCASPGVTRLDPPKPNGEAVILVHGLARTSRSMGRLATSLSEAGYTVYSLQYPSRTKTVEQIADEDLAALLTTCRQAKEKRIHFVAHSLGNIVVRQYLATHRLTNIGRVVMLGPPNQGSEVVDSLGGLRLFRWINGPAGLQLGTSSRSPPWRLPAPSAEVGVIAGTHSINWILSCLIPGPDDGKVSVERTRLVGMADFATVPVSHPFLMRDREAVELTLAFLRNGSFRRAKAGSL